MLTKPTEKLLAHAMDIEENYATDIRELDKGLQERISKAGQISGYTVLAWNGTTKQIINGATFYISEYKRSPVNENSNTVVRLVRMLSAGKSFTMTIAYHEDREYLLRPICDRIISSLRIN